MNTEVMDMPEYPSIELGPVSVDYMGRYGINIILQRAIPQLADGMKPIHRRILYAMWRAKRDKLIKVAEIQGEVMKFSPHGEIGTRFIVAGLAQPFSNNAPYLTPHGNCGTAIGEDCSAARYWDARVSDFAMEVFFSEFDGKVNMKPNYDGEYMEPITLPAKFPTILLNGSTGIAYTMSSDLLPYNLNEVADATIKLLKNPEAKVNLIPDSPTGCDVFKRDDFTFVMQSSYDIDNVNYTITIKNTPFGEYLNAIDKRLSLLQSNPATEIKEILSADNESELIEGKFRYVIRCRPCNLYSVVSKLFKKVPGFRVTLSTRNAKVIDVDLKQHTYTERQILCAWIRNRLQEKRSYYLRKLVDFTTEYNMLEAKKFMLSPENLNKTIKVFRSCEEEDELIESLMNAYKGKVSSSQARYISDLKMSRLTHGEYMRTLNKLGEMTYKIQELREILNDPEKIKEKIIHDIQQIKAKYGRPRLSHIMNNNSGESVHIGVCQIMTDGCVIFSETENPDHFASDVTPIKGTEVCLIDNYGRFLWVDTTKVQQGKPLTLTSIGKQPMDRCIAAVSNKDWSIVMLTNKGRIKLMPINKIPSNASKKPLIPLMDGEYLVSVLEVSSMSDDLLMYTSDGLGKRFSVSDLNLVTSPDAQGQFIVKEDVDASGIFIVNNKKPLIFYVTRLGRVRANAAKFLVTGKKFGGLKPIIPLSAQDDLIAVFCCDPTQSVTMYHADGRVSCVNVDSQKPTTMSMPPAKPKHVPAVKVIRATLS